MNEKQKLKLCNKEKLIDIIEKLSIEYALKLQQYEYIRHNDYSNDLQARIDKAIERITWYTKQFDNFSDKDLITNRAIDIEILYYLLDILKGSDSNE